MRSAVAEVQDEVTFPWYKDFSRDVLAQTVLPRAQNIESFIAFDEERGGWAANIWPQIIINAYPELAGYSFHNLLMQLVLKSVDNRVSGRANLDFVENFAGKAMITCHLIQKGLVGKRHDIVYRHCKEQDADFYNACTPTGSR